MVSVEYINPTGVKEEIRESEAIGVSVLMFGELSPFSVVPASLNPIL